MNHASVYYWNERVGADPVNGDRRTTASPEVDAHFGMRENDAETIVGELVMEFLRCPDAFSGILFC